MLKKDLDYILPKLDPDERGNAELVLKAIEDIIPERRGAYKLSEVAAALRTRAKHTAQKK